MPILRIIAILLLLLPCCAIAQPSPSFEELLQRAGLELLHPPGAGYRPSAMPDAAAAECQWAVRSRSEGLEIRYAVLPWDEADPAATNPHVATQRLLSSVASNADEAVISAIRPGSEELRTDFNADWGMVFFFQPKPSFSDQPACKLLALCKEGQGTVFIFFLFSDPGNPALDLRAKTVRFD